MKIQIRMLVVLALGATGAAIGETADGYWSGPFGLRDDERVGISAMAIDGQNLYVAGNFTSLGGIAATNIAKWDGTKWSPLGGGLGSHPDHTVMALAVEASTLYAGGVFTRSGDRAITNIAKWDGRNWSPLPGEVNPVYALALSGTNLFVGGNFLQAGGTLARNIARWDGTKWAALGGGVRLVNPLCADCTPGVEYGSVGVMLAQENTLFVAGRFDRAGDVNTTNIAKWNGETWSTLAGGVNGIVGAMAVNGGYLYVGGAFYPFGSVSTTNVAGWNGMNWFSLDGGVEDGFSIQALASDGTNLYAGGTFRKIGGVYAPRIAKWDGNTWTSLGSGIQPEGLGIGVGFLVCNGTQLYAGGVFNSAGAKPTKNLALWEIPQKLALSKADNIATISWPAADGDFLLETIGDLNRADWSPVPRTPALVQNRLVVTNDLSTGKSFYRLSKQ